MRTPPPALLPLLRSHVQGELLALLYLHPDGEYSLTDAAKHIGVTPRAVHAEASRLVAGGLIADRRVGNPSLSAWGDTPAGVLITDEGRGEESL